ncbi:hypothetical protein A2954_00125 [Candidatus Roizmanbacteria bacterium RIFCSPLOWO2_01_FULL_37_12]|uniref:Uncharacterized protein n=1 Tax=Candidatus Roizmanbacteria bacterium RIFCSPLOWO2_01_FULL_37_12 TaxID=1802056 RepID=A0A1F7I9G8_9BACT|nr:MAG: hypothetical protein A3D76_01630 [Candidatus Roizmanbacteria bacterium RIFCSPHIGHO2_02_FULL_37_9b]OGK40015.1 MAG: hypothetical protein A2954_00125 [Candidatus Roizmanbacteria bacterium RIFCSPLOWO2_01_FULL_37_12]
MIEQSFKTIKNILRPLKDKFSGKNKETLDNLQPSNDSLLEWNKAVDLDYQNYTTRFYADPSVENNFILCADYLARMGYISKLAEVISHIGSTQWGQFFTLDSAKKLWLLQTKQKCLRNATVKERNIANSANPNDGKYSQFIEEHMNSANQYFKQYSLVTSQISKLRSSTPLKK